MNRLVVRAPNGMPYEGELYHARGSNNILESDLPVHPMQTVELTCFGPANEVLSRKMLIHSTKWSFESDTRSHNDQGVWRCKLYVERIVCKINNTRVRSVEFAVICTDQTRITRRFHELCRRNQKPGSPYVKCHIASSITLERVDINSLNIAQQ